VCNEGNRIMTNAKKILVVDDNVTIMRLLEKRLTAEGYSVLTACDGKQGFAIASREVPDLIVSDVDMPVMDGGEMVSKLKSMPLTSRIPVIFLTGLITKDEGGPHSSGETFYMSKMSKPAELIAAVKTQLALYSK